MVRPFITTFTTCMIISLMLAGSHAFASDDDMQTNSGQDIEHKISVLYDKLINDNKNLKLLSEYEKLCLQKGDYISPAKEYARGGYDHKAAELFEAGGATYMAGEYYYRAKDYDKAIKLLETDKANDPDYADTHYYLQKAYFETGEYRKSLDELQQYEFLQKEKYKDEPCERYPWDLYHYKARIYMGLGFYYDALFYYNQYIYFYDNPPYPYSECDMIGEANEDVYIAEDERAALIKLMKEKGLLDKNYNIGDEKK